MAVEFYETLESDLGDYFRATLEANMPAGVKIIDLAINYISDSGDVIDVMEDFFDEFGNKLEVNTTNRQAAKSEAKHNPPETSP